MADNIQIKDGLGNLFTLRAHDASQAHDGSLQTSMFLTMPYGLDYGAGGTYQRCDTSAVFLSGLPQPGPIYSFQWTASHLVAAINRLRISLWSGSTAFSTPGMASFSIFTARQFMVQDEGGVSVNFQDGSNRLRGSMALEQADVMVATNAVLTPGSRVLDSAPLHICNVAIPTVANAPFSTAPLPLFEKLPGEHPLILAVNEGFIVNANVPGDGTWQFAITLEWSGLSSY